MPTIYSKLNSHYNFSIKTVDEIDSIIKITTEELTKQFERTKPLYASVIRVGRGETQYQHTLVRTNEHVWIFGNGVIWKFNPNAMKQPRGHDENVDEGKGFNKYHKQLFKEIGYCHYDLNQYKYCEALLKAFWKNVFNKTPDEMWSSGIVTAHGDKGYGYRDEWEAAGIPFNRGMLIYLLTYTTEMDRGRSQANEFVIFKYKHYLPLIKAAEKEVFFI